MNNVRICKFNRLSWVSHGDHHILCTFYFQKPSWKFPLQSQPILSILCHVRFHGGFSSIENAMGCSSKLLSCKPKVGAHDTLCPHSPPMKDHTNHTLQSHCWLIER